MSTGNLGGNEDTDDDHVDKDDDDVDVDDDDDVRCEVTSPTSCARTILYG